MISVCIFDSIISESDGMTWARMEFTCWHVNFDFVKWRFTPLWKVGVGYQSYVFNFLKIYPFQVVLFQLRRQKKTNRKWIVFWCAFFRDHNEKSKLKQALESTKTTLFVFFPSSIIFLCCTNLGLFFVQSKDRKRLIAN